MALRSCDKLEWCIPFQINSARVEDVTINLHAQLISRNGSTCDIQSLCLDSEDGETERNPLVLRSMYKHIPLHTHSRCQHGSFCEWTHTMTANCSYQCFQILPSIICFTLIIAPQRKRVVLVKSSNNSYTCAI